SRDGLRTGLGRDALQAIASRWWHRERAVNAAGSVASRKQPRHTAALQLAAKRQPHPWLVAVGSMLRPRRPPDAPTRWAVEMPGPLALVVDPAPLDGQEWPVGVRLRLLR